MAGILKALFDASVETAEVDPFSDTVGELLPEEARLLGSAAPERLLEFRAGRHCARAALARLGGAGPVLRAEDRSPVWPAGFVGSIAHTRSQGRGFCGAVAARASVLRALGIDVETDVPLDPKLWRRILRRSEEEWIMALPEGERGRSAMLVFCAKESVYKCQHPLSRTFLEFADVEVLAPGEGRFSAVLLREAGPFSAGREFHGRFVRRSGLIATGVALET